MQYCERSLQENSSKGTKEKDSALSVVRNNISEEKYPVNWTEITLRVVLSSSQVVSRCVRDYFLSAGNQLP